MRICRLEYLMNFKHSVSEFPRNGSFSKSTQILEIHTHISLVKMTHFWDIDHWNMIFRQKVANGPDLIFVELSLERLLWGAHTHSINVLLHTCIHYTLRQNSIFVLKNRIYKINSDKVYLRIWLCRIWIFGQNWIFRHSVYWWCDFASLLLRQREAFRAFQV